TKNEVAILARAFTAMIESFKKQAFILARIAEGDYTVKVDSRSDKDVINLSINIMLEETLEVLHQVATAGVQVADGSKMISHGAQLLAQGAKQQASTVEELAVSTSLIAEKTKENSDKAGKAATFAETIKHNAEESNRKMSEMMDAVSDIYQSSHNIGQVIKVIDDIAFNDVEQLSSAMSTVATKTKENAEKAETAALLADTIKSNAEKGSRQMSEMVDAVKDINQSSQKINNVIKIIDDIAFQTNILALNASVEAARAGALGKGFAVVAEEVRSLAAKSQQAAQDTGDMISNSIKKAELGSRIASDTAKSLDEIVTGINESTMIVNEIALSSSEQYNIIERINAGEVRNLASKSTAVARETNEMVSNSIEKSELGSRIAAETSKSLGEIVSGIKESAQIANDIAVSSNKQYQNIKEINSGVEQVARIVQQNAATAQESAAASEEMNAQSAVLEDLIRQFQLRKEMASRGSLSVPHKNN
ncbi:MAG: methyl-accepting chemotaxis protein, partial [Defluviitaleaceae bacterium]|nr:methyl-accepting chemotaxis protein [Defluviitaleaceae bacterium]